jgi:Dna[CI] antecedent, DciA
MHKKSLADKKTGARNRRKSRRMGLPNGLREAENPKSINEILFNRSGLRRLVDSIPAQQSWAEWLRAALAEELAGHIVSALPKDAELVVFADSPAWGARLRYALAAMQSDIAARDSTISHTTVRVQLPAASNARHRD